MSSQQIISVYPSPTLVITDAVFNITKTTNGLVWALKNEGNGVCSLYVMLNETWGDIQVLRVSYYGYVNVEMKMEACDGFPEGSISAKNVITALSAESANEATNATCANIMKSAPGQYQQVVYNANNRPANWDEINAVCYNGIRAQLVTSNLGDKTEPDGTIITFGWDMGDWETQLLIPGGDSSGKVFNPMIRTESGRREYGSWHTIPYMEDVLSSSGGTIDAKEKRCPVEIKGGTAGERQNIRLYPSSAGGYWTTIAFLDSSANDHGLTPGSWAIGAKEGFFGISKNGDGLYEEGSSYLRNNGDTWEFKGNSVIAHCDLQSTSLATSPMHVATSEFTVSPDNQPNAERTKQGNLEVTFGSVKKTIHMKYNPFMEYFFKHGYHFSAVKEGGDSTLYDRGIVTYGNFIYYCVYTYRSEDDDDFAAAIIATDDTEDMSKYVMSQGGSASELQIIGNYFMTNDLKKVEIQEKAGTLALKADIPSVPRLVDNLTTADTSSTLSANQGYVLNNKIAAIKFSQSGTNSSIGSIGPYNDLGDEDLDYSAQLHGGTYGRFYVISGFETGGHNKNYGKLAIKTSASAKKDMTTSMVAGVSGETGYWSPQWLSVSVIVPAGASYYLYGCRIKDVYFSYTELNH